MRRARFGFWHDQLIVSRNALIIVVHNAGCPDNCIPHLVCIVNILAQECMYVYACVESGGQWEMWKA